VYDLWKRRDSRVSMQFVNHTGTMIAERGPDDTSRKPPLAEAFRKNAVYPLSAIERIRGAFRAAGRVGSFTIPVYDGARRFDIVGKILPKQISSDGVLRAELTLRAIAGFKGETSEDGDPDDAPRRSSSAWTKREWCPYRSRSRSSLCLSSCSFSVSAQRPTLALNKGFRAEAGSKKGCPVTKRRAAVVAGARVDSIEFHGGLPMRPSGLLGSAQVLWDQPYSRQRLVHSTGRELVLVRRG